MIGIDSFRQYFKDFENQYVIIGGAACELLMSNQELDFRATKDIDMVPFLSYFTIQDINNYIFN